MSQAVVKKVLSEVEVDPSSSHQHEFNGVACLKDLFGKERQDLSARFFYLSNRGIEEMQEGSLTWYDARANHPTRTEYRLYYDTGVTLLSKRAKPGDTLLLTLGSSGRANIFIIAEGTQLSDFLESLLGHSETGWSVIADSKNVKAIEKELKKYQK